MSFGFFKHPAFELVAAADVEVGKPSVGRGKLQCDTTYATNIGIHPRKLDLAEVPPGDVRASLGLSPETKVHVLAVCPPCTGFSRAKPPRPACPSPGLAKRPSRWSRPDGKPAKLAR
jgi:DNA (cytosine-5)-methyltransferase 1